MLLRFLWSLKRLRLKFPPSNITAVLPTADPLTEACTSVQAILHQQGQPTARLPTARGPPMVNPLMELPGLHTARQGLDNIAHRLPRQATPTVATRQDIVHLRRLGTVRPPRQAIVRLRLLRPQDIDHLRRLRPGIDLLRQPQRQDIVHQRPQDIAHLHPSRRPLGIALPQQSPLWPLSLRFLSQWLRSPPLISITWLQRA